MNVKRQESEDAKDSCKPRAFEFCGIRIHALTSDELLQAIETTIDSRVPNNIIANHNLRSLCLVQDEPALRRYYRKTLYTHVDGMSIVLLSKVFRIPLAWEHRTAYLDWIDDLFSLAEERSWKIYFLGGTPEVADAIPSLLRDRHPRLEIRSHHGYDAFSPDATVYQEIKEFNPEIVLVGMGMPLQEKWILQSVDRLQVNLFLPCGGTMDYFAGAQKPAPRWMGSVGFEWLYRFIHSPIRLLPRYLFDPLKALPFIFGEWYKEMARAK